MMFVSRLRLPLVALLLVGVPLLARAGSAGDRVVVTMKGGFNPDRPEGGTTRELIKLMERDPAIHIQEWGGITLPGGAGRSAFLMSIAGKTAPDLYYCWFHIIRNDIRQGFVHPLNEWIGEDLDGNGMIDDDEARWEGWKRVPPLWRRVATQDGKVYGIPYAATLFFGLIYRKDMVAEAGLDPSKPPRTWDEFFYWCQRLTFPEKDVAGARLQRGQRAYGLYPYPWFWLPWMQSAGGSPIVQSRTSPTTGKTYDFPMEETEFTAPDTGEDLSGQPSTWRATFDSPAGIAAARFYHKLRWAPWIRDPATEEPVNLSEEDVARGQVTVRGRTLTFSEEDVFRGVVRPCIGQDQDVRAMFARGEVAMFQWNVEALQTYGAQAGIPPHLIGMMPFPSASEEHKRVFQVHKHYYAMSTCVGDRPKRERDKVWECLKVLTSNEVRDRGIRAQVMTGNAMWCRPDDLRRLGLDEYVRDIPVELRRFYDDVDAGEIVLRTEPFAGFWVSASDLLANNVLGFILSETGRDFDYVAALEQTTQEANRGLMFELPREALDEYRPTARVLFAVAVVVIAVCVYLIIREKYQAPTGSTGAKSHPVIPMIMLAPALLTILVWGYYPLIRGGVMMFQDYRITGGTEWVGLDNIIMVARDSNFWLYVGKTLKFVGLTMVLGFLAPIFLAFLLSEVPRGKIFFRTLFFLPQMTSGIVVALLWKMMYDPTENGVLNQLLMAFGLPSQTWLQDPFWAMFCCILPGVWAGAGMQSLIYIAALHSFPNDLYESAAIDGAGFFRRIRHITLPQLMPLIIINSIGTFIAAFQNMGHIFLLTFGGPGKETTVLGLAIWKLAYNDLRFSTATTMAWFMGTALIGLAYFQIRFLRKLEFRRAEEN